VLHLQGYHLRAKGDMLDLSRTTGVWLLAVLVFYLTQIPLWMLRAIAQMRVARQPADTLPLHSRQISLLQMFVVTSYLAVVLAAARVEVPIPGVRAAGQVALAITVLSVGFGVPFLWATLGSRHVWRGLAALLILSEVLVFVGSRLYMVAGTNAVPADWRFVVIAFRGLQAATLLVGIRTGLAARAAGYRLTASLPGIRPEDVRSEPPEGAVS
jgi:hypothetical protein